MSDPTRIELQEPHLACAVVWSDPELFEIGARTLQIMRQLSEELAAKK